MFRARCLEGARTRARLIVLTVGAAAVLAACNAGGGTPRAPAGNAPPAGAVRPNLAPASPVECGPTPAAPRRNAAAAIPVGISPGSGFENEFENMSPSQQRAVICLMKADGVALLRLDWLAPAAGASPFSPLSQEFDYQFMKQAEANGIAVDALLTGFDSIPSSALMASFAASAARTLEPIHVNTFEVLNEVNISHAGTSFPELTPKEYVPLLQAAYGAIKTPFPAATVLMSGLAPASGGEDPPEYLRDLYERGAKPFFDAANMHPYSFPAPPVPTPPASCAPYNAFCHDLPRMRAVMHAFDDDRKSIWLTEFGCPTKSDTPKNPNCNGGARSQQDAALADQITEAYRQAVAWGWTGPLFIFDWKDDAGDGPFGIYRRSGAPKPQALAAFQQIASGS